MRTLTRATLALWLNIESTQPVQKDCYGDAIAATPQRVYMYVPSLNTGKAKLEIQ